MDIKTELNAAAVAAQLAEKRPKDPETVKKATRAGEGNAHASAASTVIAAGAVGTAVVGASGASIMSTLAATGAAVGGGVVAGVGIVAGSAGLGAAKLLNNTAFKDDKEARIGTYSGAAAGTLTSLGALATAGAGPTGLAAIGSVVGGGMAAGAVILLAAPIVGAVAIGAFVHYWRKRNRAEP